MCSYFQGEGNLLVPGVNEVAEGLEGVARRQPCVSIAGRDVHAVQ